MELSLKDKDVYISEDTILNTDNVDIYKLIMEGSTITGDYMISKTPFILPKRPFIITAKKALWTNVPNHTTELKNRMIIVKFNSILNSSYGFDYADHMVKSLLIQMKEKYIK